MSRIISNYDALLTALDARIADPQHPVATRCSWCDADMGPAPWTSTQPGEVTHGMCSACLARAYGHAQLEVLP